VAGGVSLSASDNKEAWCSCGPRITWACWAPTPLLVVVESGAVGVKFGGELSFMSCRFPVAKTCGGKRVTGVAFRRDTPLPVVAFVVARLATGNLLLGGVTRTVSERWLMMVSADLLLLTWKMVFFQKRNMNILNCNYQINSFRRFHLRIVVVNENLLAIAMSVDFCRRRKFVEGRIVQTADPV